MNNVNDTFIEEYVVIENELDHFDIYQDKKLKLLDDLNLISSLRIGDFISNGIVINNTYLNKIWNYYTDYPTDTINFIEKTIVSAKDIIDDSNYKCEDHVNCNYIGTKNITIQLIKTSVGLEFHKITYSSNKNLLIRLNSIISDLQSYTVNKLVNSFLDNIISDFEIIDDYKITNNETIDITNNDDNTNNLNIDNENTETIANNETIDIKNANNKTIDIENANNDITNNENLSDSFFGNTVEKFHIYNLSSIEKELRDYEYKSKLRNLLSQENNLFDRKLYKSKLNMQQIYHNISIIQNMVHVR